MIKKKKKFNERVFALVLALVSLFATFGICVPSYSYAEESKYSNVLDDLKNDSSFNASEYSVAENDYSISVITIAESSDNELFVYTYQPSADKDIIANYITISNAFHNADYNKVYGLSLLNSNGVFFKYLVKDFVVSNDDVRYYDITDILRPFNESIDTNVDSDNVIKNVTYKVAKQFTFGTLNNKLKVSVTDTDVVEITDKYVGFVRYKNNDAPSWINKDSCDNHFIAFSTDRDIEKLYEADVYYSSQSYHHHYELFNVFTNYGDVNEDCYAYLNYTEKHSYTNDNNNTLIWGSNTFEWKEISTAQEFIANEDREFFYEKGLFNSSVETKLTDEGLNNIKSKDWVLCFTQTDYDYNEHTAGSAGAIINEYKTIIGDVKILRLKFETEGTAYNLGVVDNMQSGGENSSNETKVNLSLSDLFWWLLLAVVIIVFLITFFPRLVIGCLKYLGKFLLLILKGIWWVIKTPFAFFDKGEE